VVEALTSVSGPVVAMDARGHGKSDKPTQPDAYGETRMATDLTELCHRLHFDVFDLVGYSMGGVVSLLVALTDARVRRLVVGGLGASVVDEGFDGLVSRGTDVADALETDDPGSISDPLARSFRDFADAVGADRRALAAHVRSTRHGTLDLASIAVPTLVLAGAQDPLARDPDALVAAIPGATVKTVPGDHLRSVGHPQFRDALVAFLAED
jgi:pimeloyl-ACP methyl ester carboxylesterase